MHISPVAEVVELQVQLQWGAQKQDVFHVASLYLESAIFYGTYKPCFNDWITLGTYRILVSCSGGVINLS